MLGGLGEGVPEGTPVIRGLMEVVDGEGEPKWH